MSQLSTVEAVRFAEQATHTEDRITQPIDVAAQIGEAAVGNFDRLVGSEGRINWMLAREIGRAALLETRPIAFDERCLTGVDNLLSHRQPDGTYPQDVLDAEHINNTTRVKEPAMPYAVSTTFQEFIGGDFYWQRQTGLQIGASGYRFYGHEAGMLRGDVEVVEAIFTNERLPQGKTSVLFSARMSKSDASEEVAKHEHLADDDSIRIQWIAHNPDGSIRGKYMQSILIRSDLRSAWVSMLADPDNIFGKSIAVEDPDSALSLMKAFTEMQIDSDKLPEGVITLLEATIPYISDAAQRKEVMAMLPEYRGNQQRMAQVAEDVALRWDAFDIELADSLATGRATAVITQFMGDLGRQWTDEDFVLFGRHQTAPGEFTMTRELATRLEKAQENILCAQAALLVRNKQALKQVDAETAAQITSDVERLHELRRTGINPGEIRSLERRAAAVTASKNITVSGGCPGEIQAKFRRDGTESNDPTQNTEEEKPPLADDELGSSTFTCPSCKRENEREHYNKFKTHCDHCHNKIPRCGPETKSKVTSAAAAVTLKDLVPKGIKHMFALAA